MDDGQNNSLASYYQEQPVVITPPSQNPPQRTKVSKWIVIGIFLIIILTTGVGGYVLYQKYQPDRSGLSAEIFPTITINPNIEVREPKLIAPGYRNGLYVSSYTLDLGHYALRYSSSSAERKDCTLVFDGKDTGECDMMLQMFGFSKNGESSYYIFPDDNLRNFTPVINGERKQSYRDIHQFAFSPDGKSYMYSASSKNGDVLVVDGEERSLGIRDINRIAYGPDGKTIVVAGQREGGTSQSVVNVNGEFKYEVSPITKIKHIIVSKTGKIGFVAEDFGSLTAPTRDQFVFIDKEKFGPFDVVNDLRFSPDGESFGFTTVERDNSVSELYIDGKSVVKVTGDDLVYRFLYSPNGKKYSYRIENLKSHDIYLYYGDDKYGPYKFINGPAFSNDSNSVAYFAAAELGTGLYHNGKLLRTGKYDVYSPIVYSQDDRNIMYYGFRGDDLWFEVQNIDGPYNIVSPTPSIPPTPTPTQAISLDPAILAVLNQLQVQYPGATFSASSSAFIERRDDPTKTHFKSPRSTPMAVSDIQNKASCENSGGVWYEIKGGDIPIPMSAGTESYKWQEENKNTVVESGCDCSMSCSGMQNQFSEFDFLEFSENPKPSIKPYNQYNKLIFRDELSSCSYMVNENNSCVPCVADTDCGPGGDGTGSRWIDSTVNSFCYEGQCRYRRVIYTSLY